MADNIVNCWPNRLNEATLINVTGTYNSEWPLAYIKDPVIQAVAKTTSTSNIIIGIDLPVVRPIGVIALINHNLSVSAEWKVSAWRDNTKTVLRNTPTFLKVWPRLYQSRNLVWGVNNWWMGSIEEEQRVGFTHICTEFLSTNYDVQYLEIEISDPSNPAGFLELGRIFIGQVIQFTNNPTLGNLSYGYIDETEVTKTLTGAKYFFQHKKQRTVNYTISTLDIDEAFGAVYDAWRSQGISGEILHAYSKTPGLYSYARTFLANFASLDKIGFVSRNALRYNSTDPANLHSATINLEEII